MKGLSRATVVFLLIAAWAVGSSATSAHHFDNGHSEYLYPPVDNWELPGTIVNGQPIKIYKGFAPLYWLQHLNDAASSWNAALYPTTGFNVFSLPLNGNGATVTVNAGDDSSQCGFTGGSPDHGCVFGDTWNGWIPEAIIYMYAPAFVGSDAPTHRLSDLMHEMGHVLYHADEHYPDENCASIMGHCPSYTSISDHDKDDFADAYRLMEAPNGAYAQLTSSSNLRHFFEYQYYTGGGYGLTLHSEKVYVVDYAVNNVTGQYDFFTTTARRVDNVDDASPNSFDSASLPPDNTEWCFKIRGETGAIANTSETHRWSPRSRAYCIRNTNNGGYVLSNRNDYVAFRVWNYSNTDMHGTSLWLDGGLNTKICDFGTVPRGSSSGVCFAWLGNGAGFLDLWYNFVEAGSIGYDAR